MRHRLTDNRTTVTYTNQTRGSCAASFSNSFTSDTVGMLKEIWDCKTPGYYRTRNRGGVLPYLPVVINRMDISVTPVTSTTTYLNIAGAPCTGSTGSYSLSSTYYNALPGLSGPDLNRAGQLVNAAVASAKSESYDALTSMAELRKSTDMIGTRVSATFNIANKCARKASRHRSLKQQVKVFNQLWLEARYGWRPLLGEIGDIVQQLTDGDYSRNKSSSSFTEDLSAVSTPKVTPGTTANRTGTAVRSGTRTLRGFALAEGNFGSHPDFNPIQTAWELVPFSFVVDWFFDVGSYLTAITPMPGVVLRASGFSMKDSYTETYTVSGVDTPGSANTAYAESSPYIKVVTYENYARYAYGVSLPSFVPRLNTLKLVDIGALVLQRALPLSRFITKR